MNKSINRVWTFASASDPDIQYQTLQYSDGTTSCDCKGWTRRVSFNQDQKHFLAHHRREIFLATV